MAMSVLVTKGSAALISIGVMALAATAGVLIYKILKLKLVRERPYITNGGIRLGAQPLDRYSFPSGHTLHAANFTIMFGDLDPILLFLALPFAILVAVSRVVLGLHYPSDVLVGALIGSCIAVAAISPG
jgi:undecaprenyl-diphosphatase